MDKIKIGDLAVELGIKPTQILDELKRLGVFITATSFVDSSLAERVRKRLSSAAAEAEKKPEKGQKEKSRVGAKAAVSAAAKKVAAKDVAKELPGEAKDVTIRRRSKKAASAEETQPPLEPPVVLMGTVGRPVEAEKEKQGTPSLALKGHMVAKARRVPKVKSAEPAVIPEAEITSLEAPPSVVIIVEPLTVPEEIPVVSEEAKPPEVEVPLEAAITGVPESVEVPAQEAVPGISVAKPEPVITPTAAPPVSTAKAIPPKAQPKILKKTTAEVARGKADMSSRLFKTGTGILAPGRKQLKPSSRPIRKKRPGEGHPRQQETSREGAGRHEEIRQVTPALTLRSVQLTEGLSIKELSERIEVKAKDILSSLFKKGILTTINKCLDSTIITQICEEHGFRPEFRSYEAEMTSIEDAAQSLDDLAPRAPVVTIMGHVDHGKTSLLDAIRETRVTEQEAGGITQHIGAYHVEINGRQIVFLDTPGHEAFTMMRARGAQVTDIVVLVVAADDGVKPQTVEAIHHARDAKVPIVVAINKIDKPEAQPDRVRQTLTDHGLTAEEWGGDTVMVNVSAKKRLHLHELLEMILLVADLKDLKANPKRLASGAVLEAKLDRGRGAVATILVQNGTLKVGDYLIAGSVYGRVRAMFDDRGNNLKEAGPSTPIEVLGLQALPQAGDIFNVVEDADKAKSVGSHRQELLRERQQNKSSRMTLDYLYELLKTDEQKELPIILKADVQGSVEVLSETILKLSNDRVKIRLVHSAAGAITEGDVLLASAANSIIIGFNVRPEKGVQEIAERENVDLRLYTVIYDVANEIRQAMVGLLEATLREKTLGSAEVRDTFRIPKIGTIAGCHVTDGSITRNALIRLLRDNIVIHKGRIGSLKRFKEDANEVRTGFECGICLERYNDIKVGDIIEAYLIEKVLPLPMTADGGGKKS